MLAALLAFPMARGPVLPCTRCAALHVSPHRRTTTAAEMLPLHERHATPNPQLTLHLCC